MGLDILKKISRKLLKTEIAVRMRYRGLQVYREPRAMQESFLMSKDTKRLLVIGPSRSGTSLFQRLLNAHPDVFVVYESIYSPFLKNNNWNDINAYIFEIIRQYRHLCLALHDGTLPVDALKPDPFKHQYLYFGDKVIYITHKGFRKRLRRAIHTNKVDKVIFLVRDPRARMSSYFQWVHQEQNYHQQTAEDWAYQVDPANQTWLLHEENSLWNEFAQDALEFTANDNKCTYLKYEDLVTTPTQCFMQLLDFLNLDNATYPQHALESIKSTSIDKWRTELDQNVIEQVTTITRPYLERFKYL